MDYGKLIVAAALGAADIAAEEYDRSKGYTEFPTASDILRLGALAVGLFGDVFGVPPAVSDSLTVASIPLVEKTIYRVVKGYTQKKSYVRLVPVTGSAPKPAQKPSRRIAITV